VSGSPDETRALGIRLGQAACPGDVVLLEGEFGAGKTVLVQGLAEGLGVESQVTSPSFVIMNQHQGRLTLFHVDLYRVEQLDPELEDTVFETVESGGVTAIEWPGLLPESLRRDATLLRLAGGDDHRREIVLETPRAALAEAAGGEAIELDPDAEPFSSGPAPGSPDPRADRCC
jgi:tRNA threonylcarbamoyladenosine biosynthesis protein TsaE